MKKYLSFIILALSGIQLNAQELYFIRAEVNTGYQYSALPPTQVIAYTPNQDTLLRVYKDYTNNLPYSYDETSIKALEFYPEYNIFIFKPLYGDGFESYALYADNIDTLIKIPTQCPEGYNVSAFQSMNIINTHWAYQCCCDNNNIPKKDQDKFKGIDFSLSSHFDMSVSNFKDLYLTGEVAKLMVIKPNDGQIYLPIVADIENRPVFSVKLPQKYWSNNELYTVVWVNDSHKTLIQTKKVNPTKNEEYGRFYAALFNKDKNTWSDVKLKGNSPTIMTYGRWIAGTVQDKTDWDTKFFVRNRISPGKVAIINGEKLGNAELLVRNKQIIPYIHWAFFNRK